MPPWVRPRRARRLATLGGASQVPELDGLEIGRGEPPPVVAEDDLGRPRPAGMFQHGQLAVRPHAVEVYPLANRGDREDLAVWAEPQCSGRLEVDRQPRGQVGHVEHLEAAVAADRQESAVGVERAAVEAGLEFRHRPPGQDLLRGEVPEGDTALVHTADPGDRHHGPQPAPGADRPGDDLAGPAAASPAKAAPPSNRVAAELGASRSRIASARYVPKTLLTPNPTSQRPSWVGANEMTGPPVPVMEETRGVSESRPSATRTAPLRWPMKRRPSVEKARLVTGLAGPGSRDRSARSARRRAGPCHRGCQPPASPTVSRTLSGIPGGGIVPAR